jgi:hypothetical protein
MRGSASKPPPLLALALAAVLGALPGAAGAAGPLYRPVPKILSASWGTEEAVGCPSGAKELDNIPVTFNWFIRGLKLPSRDFQVIRSDGTVATPTCAIRFPPDERDEAQTVNLIGDFGNSANGPKPVAVRVVGKLEGKAPGAHRWRPIRHLAPAKVDPIADGPYIVDAWTIMPSIYRHDKNRCEVGTTFVRVMWSNGLTAYSFNADNMHDLCLPEIPRGARLAGITIGADLIQDPDGDPNLAQRFALH